MALQLDTQAVSGGARLPVKGAYLQARPLVMDKATRNQTDENGDPVLVDGEPVTESYWYLNVALRWWTAAGGEPLRVEPEIVKLEIDPDKIEGNPIAAIYERLKLEPGFENAEDV